MKRFFDLVLASLLLLVAAAVILPAVVLTWLYDRKSPFYIAPRIGKNGVPFNMVKLRSMTVRAPSFGGSPSTPSNDNRITPIGRVVRKYKLDELLQLINVIIGDMSLVGPRPQVAVGAAAYTPVERRLLTVKPGITDFASVVFSDEGDILAGQPDPDLAYDQLIRPGKSWLGLFYIENRTLALDFKLVFLTGVAIFSKSLALAGVVATLRTLNAPAELVRIARRKEPLRPMPPPGATTIVATANTAPQSWFNQVSGYDHIGNEA